MHVLLCALAAIRALMPSLHGQALKELVLQSGAHTNPVCSDPHYVAAVARAVPWLSKLDGSDFSVLVAEFKERLIAGVASEYKSHAQSPARSGTGTGASQPHNGVARVPMGVPLSPSTRVAMAHPAGSASAASAAAGGVGGSSAAGYGLAPGFPLQPMRVPLPQSMPATAAVAGDLLAVHTPRIDSAIQQFRSRYSNGSSDVCRVALRCLVCSRSLSVHSVV
jgi:hypothetical protein